MVASSMEELNSSANEVTVITANSKEIAAESRDKVYNGRQILQDIINSIEGIKTDTENLSSVINALIESSREITGLLDVISDIADQTNLLALNAAIEAARAGESGRGFAVVAEEVRKLALRTTDSVKKVGSIIDALKEQSINAEHKMETAEHSVIEGVNRVSEAEKVFINIVSLIDKMYEYNLQIENSSKEQATTINNTNDTIQVIASSLEETGSALLEVKNTIENLQKKIEDVNNKLNTFKT
jgi:methyl-accepting chemotaxis protein